MIIITAGEYQVKKNNKNEANKHTHAYTCTRKKLTHATQKMWQ